MQKYVVYKVRMPKVRTQMFVRKSSYAKVRSVKSTYAKSTYGSYAKVRSV